MPPAKLTRLQRLSLFFFGHFKTTMILWITVVLFGTLSYTTLLRREGFPPFELAIGTAGGTYFVNDPARVDREVAKPLTDLIRKQPDVKGISTTSGDNFYMLEIEFKEGTNATAASKRLDSAVREAKIMPANATVEFKPLEFGVDPDNQGDDLLIAFFSKEPKDLAVLNSKAQEAVKFLQQDATLKASVQRVRAVELYRTGTDPVTGQPVTEQKAFDRTGVRNDEFKFFPSTEIALKAKAGVDELHLYDETAAALNRLRAQEAFKGYDVTISANTAEGIREQISSLQQNLLSGLVAVIVISFLLISLRASVVTALAMTTVLTMTIAILLLIDYSLNTITLFSLILCLGLIVDDTTIMVEAIDAERHSRKSRREIVADAVKKVARASTAGTFVTMLGFAPMLFIGGFLGDIIWGIPVTIMISLAVSLLISLTLVPFLARVLVPRMRGRRESFSPLARAEAFMSRKLADGLHIGRRSHVKLSFLAALALGLSLAMTAAGGALFSKLTFNIFPATKDSNIILETIRFPEGTTVAAAEAITDEVDTISAAELGSHIRQASLYGTGSDKMTMLNIQLTSYKDRDIKSPELIQRLKNKLAGYPKAQVSVAQGDAGPPPGVFAARVFYDADHAPAAALAHNINTYLSGREFKRPDGSIFHIEQSQVTPAHTLLRDDGRPYVEVQATFDATDTTALVTIAQDAVEDAFPKSRVASYGLSQDALSFDFGSESENQESFKAMIVAFPILLIGMYLLLAFQFRSLLQPLLIFVALPFSIFGITAGLYITDNPFSFFTLIGVFALIGISVNNTILLTDYANQAQAAGERRIDAIATAVRARFRPLITTSLTSVVALTPLALTDPFWESLAVTLIFGLLSSTILVVIAFPYYYLGSEFLRVKFTRSRVLLWLGALIGGTAILAATDQGAYMPLWWLICILIRPVHSINQRIVRRAF
jgi:multidrug efflux pump subunit AcrB